MEKELEKQSPVPAVSLLLPESSVEYSEWVERELGNQSNQRKRDGGQDCVMYSVDFVDFTNRCFKPNSPNLKMIITRTLFSSLAISNILSK